MLDHALAFALRRKLPGAFRLVRAVRGKYPPGLVRVRTAQGLDWTVDPGSFIDAAVLRRGFYEGEILDTILTTLSDGVFWDIGANVGLLSVTAKALRPAATVVAFEPVPYMAARLMLHSQMNNADVTVAPFALGETPGYAPLSVKLSGNSGLSSLRPWEGVTYDAVMQVRVERADHLIALGVFPQPDAIKIDVEGFGARGAARLSATASPASRPSSSRATAPNILRSWRCWRATCARSRSRIMWRL